MTEAVVFLVVVSLIGAFGFAVYHWGKQTKKYEVSDVEVAKTIQRTAGLDDGAVVAKLRKHNSKSKISSLPE